MWAGQVILQTLSILWTNYCHSYCGISFRYANFSQTEGCANEPCIFQMQEYTISWHHLAFYSKSKRKYSYTQALKTENFPMRISENVHSKSNHCTYKAHSHAGDKVFSVWTVILPFPHGTVGWESQGSGSSPSLTSCSLWCQLTWSGRVNYFHHSNSSALIIMHTANYSRRQLYTIKIINTKLKTFVVQNIDELGVLLTSNNSLRLVPESRLQPGEDWPLLSGNK